MKRTVLAVSVAALTVLGVGLAYGFVRYTDSQPAPASEVLCEGDPSTERKFLVVGDSWAARGRLNAGMLSSLGNAYVCSIGYPGATTEKILAAYLRDAGSVSDQMGGAPKHTVVLAGVNDFITGRGPSYYTSNLLRLAETLPGEVHVMGLPWVQPKSPGILDQVKSVVFSCAYSFCTKPELDAYRAAAQDTWPALIDYAAFAPIYIDTDYDDGVHLTAEKYQGLGAYIGAGLASLGA